MAFVRSSVLESAAWTQSLTPSNVRARPNLPVVERVGPFIVPVLLFPELSTAVVPEVYFTQYAARIPVGSTAVAGEVPSKPFGATTCCCSRFTSQCCYFPRLPEVSPPSRLRTWLPSE